MASLIAQESLDYIPKVLGAAPPIAAMRILNMTGRALAAMRAWAFLCRPPAKIDLNAGQDHIVLPEGLLEIKHIRGSSYVYGLKLTDISIVEDARQGTWSIETGYFIGSLVFQDDTAARLEIYPSPSGSVIDAMRISGRYGWKPIGQDDVILGVPDWLEPLWYTVLREVTMGLIRPMDKSIPERLEPVRNSRLYKDAANTDGGFQTDYGEQGGGALMHCDVPVQTILMLPVTP